MKKESDQPPKSDIENLKPDPILYGSKLEDVQIKRLEIEIEKIEAEKKKALAEEKRILKDLNKTFFKTKDFYQGIVAGLVAIPLIWFYVTEVALPLHESKNYKLKNKYEYAKDSLVKSRENLNQAIAEFKNDKERFIIFRDSMHREYKHKADLLEERNELYEKLKNNYLALDDTYINLIKEKEFDDAKRNSLQIKHQELSSNHKQILKEVERIDEQLKLKDEYIDSLSIIVSEKEAGSNQNNTTDTTWEKPIYGQLIILGFSQSTFDSEAKISIYNLDKNLYLGENVSSIGKFEIFLPKTFAKEGDKLRIRVEKKGFIDKTKEIIFLPRNDNFGSLGSLAMYSIKRLRNYPTGRYSPDGGSKPPGGGDGG